MKQIIVTGGTGFIGQKLVSTLKERDYEVTVISREGREAGVIKIDLANIEPSPDLFEGVEAVIHLVGAPIFQRWNRKTKQAIYDSRILSTRNVVAALAKTKKKPKALISASAIGYYGDRGEEILDESAPPSTDFLARVCVDWEQEARTAESLGIRAIQVRTAPVLGKGGILDLLTPLYRSGLGAILGSGKQWFPWIHHTDIVGVYLFCLEQTSLKGPVNACSPRSLRYVDFARTLAAVLRRPLLLRVPPWLLRLVIGEFASATLVSQRATPKRLIDAGYTFQFPELEEALTSILAKK